MVLKNQTQSAEHGAIAIQAQGDVQVQAGVSYESARQIALDVYQANFPILVAEAASLARARAEELTDKFLKQLQQENPGGFSQAANPDFQNALLSAQREHACAGNAELADLLVDLLVDRTKQPERNLMQLVIDEALKTAPKLTEQQLAVLGVVFLLSRARSNATSWPGVISWMSQLVLPVLKNVEVTPSTISHLQFTGCGTVGLMGADLAQALWDAYSGFFQSGFTDEQLEAKLLPDNALRFISSLDNSDNLKQVNIPNLDVVDVMQKDGAFDTEAAEKLKALIRDYRISPSEIKERVLLPLPSMSSAFDLWDKEYLGKLALTSVGMAIGHAYVKKTIRQEFAPLSIWIN